MLIMDKLAKFEEFLSSQKDNQYEESKLFENVEYDFMDDEVLDALIKEIFKRILGKIVANLKKKFGKREIKALMSEKDS